MAAETQLTEFAVLPVGNGLEQYVTLLAAAGQGDQYFALVVAGQVQGFVWLPEARRVRALASAADGQPVSAYACGASACVPAGEDAATLHLAWAADKGLRVRVLWTAPLEYEPRGTGSEQLSAWALAGLRRGKNLAPVAGKPQRGELQIQIAALVSA